MMNWRIIFRFGLLLLLAGTTIGALESGLSPQDGPARYAVFLGGYAALFVAYTAILARLGYRQAYRPFAHAALAVAVQVALATLALAAVHLYLLALPTSDTYIFILVEWAITAVALVVGVPAGRSLANRVAVGSGL